MQLSELAASIESEILRHVYDCWRRNRTDRRAPPWSRIAALNDPIIEAHAWVWRHDPATDRIISLVMGPKAREVYPEDPVGRAVREFYPERIRDIVEGNFRNVFERPALHRSYGIVYWREGRADMGERIILPVRFASDDAPDAVMGAAVFDYTVTGAIAPAEPPPPLIDLAPLYDD